MKKIILATICIILIVTLPISIAQTYTPYTNPYSSPASSYSGIGSNLGGFAYQDPLGNSLRRNTIGYGEPIFLGSSIQINVADYEPKQVRQSYLEQTNALVFIYLKGTTLGTVSSLLTGDPEQRDPFSGTTNLPKIISVDVTMNQTSEGYQYITGPPRYFPPRPDRVSLNNMGALVLYLKQIEDEDNLPEGNTISLQMNARILFDLQESNLFGLSPQSLTLKPQTDDDEFALNKERNSIFSGKGYVRVLSVDSAGATVGVYSRDLNPIFLSTLPSKSPTVSAGLPGKTVFRLREGHPQTLSFGYTGNPLQDTFQIMLEDIVTPGDNAEFKFSFSGKGMQRKVNENNRLTKNSDWVLEKVLVSESKDISKNDAARKYDLTLKEFTLLEEFLEILGESTILYETTYTAVIRNSLREERKLERTVLTAKDGTALTIPADDLDDEAARILEEAYCPYREEGQLYILNEDNLEEKGISELACQAVVRYRNIIDNYPNSPEVKLAYNDLFELYSSALICLRSNEGGDPPTPSEKLISCKIDTLGLAKYYMQKSGLSADLSLQIYDDSKSIIYLEDMGVSLELLKTEKISNTDRQGSVNLKIYDESGVETKESKPEEWKVGEKIIGEITYPKKTNLGWYIIRINPGAVTFGLKEEKPESSSLQQITIKLHERGQIPMVYGKSGTAGTIQPTPGGREVEVENIQTNTEAVITVLPGSQIGYTESIFNLNIPIDPRPFKWTDEMLNDHINVTDSIIKKLDDVIETLDEVVSTWKKVCLGTFAFLTLKSSLLGSPIRAQARKISSSIVKEDICKDEILNKKYRTVQHCLTDKGEEISSTTNAIEQGYNEAKEKLKGDIDSISGVSIDHCSGFEDYKDAARAQGKLDHEILKDYSDCYAYSSALLTVGEDTPIGKSIINKMSGIDEGSIITLYTEAKTKLEESSEFKKLNPDQKQRLIAAEIESRRKQAAKETAAIIGTVETTKEKEESSSFGDLQKGITIIKGKKGATEVIAVNRYLQGVIDNGGVDDYNKKICERYKIAKDCNNNIILKRTVETEKSLPATTAGQGIYLTLEDYYKIDNNKNDFKKEEINYLKSQVTFDPNRNAAISAQYYQNKLEAVYNEDGQPVCYPTGKGEYVKVEQNYPTGATLAKTVSLWNVGLNGRINCGKPDDVLMKASSELELPENIDLKNKLIRTLTQAGQCNEDKQSVGSIAEGIVRCSKLNIDQLTSVIKPECTDVMEYEDCKILFNACDPVMCPSSRCDLGGAVAPRNVIQSGIIGSIALCAPNIKEGIVVPVCLTGIDAGLKNIRSLAQSYKDCLEIKLNQNDDVGFCDYIRSVGICEVMWREGASLADLSGGVLDWATGKIFGDPKGGGEYLNFQNQFQNVGDTVEFFTNEYKETYAAQFLGKSTEDIGSEICRLSVNGRIPHPGDILDYLTEPEDPPQFTAFFDEAPYAGPGELASVLPGTAFQTQELSLYKAFYHIYAGTGYYQGVYSQPTSLLGPKPQGIQQPILYSVYLIDKARTLPPLYVTYPEDSSSFFSAYQGQVEPGKYVQQSVQKAGPRGYDQICVNINGQETCGFGKTSSSFGLQELQDALEASQGGEQNIKSADECTTKYADRSSMSVSRLAALGATAAAGGVGFSAGGSLIGGTATANVIQGTSPAIGAVTSGIDRSALSTGITRVCAFTPPTEPSDRWQIVGTCGKDPNGINLGDCYLDTQSISIRDAGIKEDLLNELRKRDPKFEDIETINAQTSVQALTALNTRRDELIESIQAKVDAGVRARKANKARQALQ